MTTRDMPGLGLVFSTFMCFVAISRGGLYFKDDNVVLLNAANINDTVYNVSNAWIIQFYNSWCGHCQNFAPTWRIFAKQVIDWDRTIKAAVIDCYVPANGRVCRNYEVQGTPTIRLFRAFVDENSLGKALMKRGVIGMQEAMISFLIEQQGANMGSPNWVNLLRFNGLINNIHQIAPPEAEYSVIILEWPKSVVGRFVILDLGKYSEIYVRTMAGKPYHLQSYDLKVLPAVFIVDREGNVEVLKQPGRYRETMTNEIITHLKLENQSVPQIQAQDDLNNVETTVESILPTTCTHAVYMVDIENTLSYALQGEVSIRKNITGEAFKALKLFTDVLVKYLPTRPQVHEYLVNLKEYLTTINTVTGEDFEALLKNISSPSSALPKEQQPWKRCLGSKPRFRGYPCGLWTVFHTLTVNAPLKATDEQTYDPLEVMRAIHGYVKNFFSCDQCSEHFQEMYALDAEQFVTDAETGIIWFWKAHNKVNKRLAGDITEDPYYPKQQFPSFENCDHCYQMDGLFNVSEVKKYLGDIYHMDAILHDGVEDLSNRGLSDTTPQNNGTNNIFRVFISILFASITPLLSTYV